jgi:tRNA G18 (ribose-2'-O)-methylase SpoU
VLDTSRVVGYDHAVDETLRDDPEHPEPFPSEPQTTHAVSSPRGGLRTEDRSPAWPALTTRELVARKPSAEAFRQLPRSAISVVLDDIRSLANVGLIFRLCDALRIERLYVCGITGYPPLGGDDPRPPEVQARARREIDKTAVMAVPFVPWSYAPSAVEVVDRLRATGYQAVAVEQAHGSVRFDQAGLYRAPLCLILGHERVGVAPDALSQADLCVEIPVYGMANSLNVAMALGLVGYEVLRQHQAFGMSAL